MPFPPNWQNSENSRHFRRSSPHERVPEVSSLRQGIPTAPVCAMVSVPGGVGSPRPDTTRGRSSRKTKQIGVLRFGRWRTPFRSVSNATASTDPSYPPNGHIGKRNKPNSLPSKRSLTNVGNPTVLDSGMRRAPGGAPGVGSGNRSLTAKTRRWRVLYNIREGSMNWVALVAAVSINQSTRRTRPYRSPERGAR